MRLRWRSRTTRRGGCAKRRRFIARFWQPSQTMRTLGICWAELRIKEEKTKKRGNALSEHCKWRQILRKLTIYWEWRCEGWSAFQKHSNRLAERLSWHQSLPRRTTAWEACSKHKAESRRRLRRTGEHSQLSQT